jgi:transposase InsO family protein
MMLDADIVAVSPSSVYRVLKQAGLLRTWARKTSKKGTGFEQPTAAHQHWHVDIAYINIRSTFFYLCSILDGWSRYIVHWELKAQITELDLEIILLRAKEIFPHANPRIISDNGSQFVARDFKQFIRLMEMTHVRTSPYYPQSNGKIERYHRSIKSECIRISAPLSLEDGRSLTAGYVSHYNTARLHSAIGYITPVDKLLGRDQTIFAERKAKLLAARSARSANPPQPP